MSFYVIKREAPRMHGEPAFLGMMMMMPPLGYSEAYNLSMDQEFKAIKERHDGRMVQFDVVDRPIINQEQFDAYEAERREKNKNAVFYSE